MALIQINRDPSRRQLTEFGLAWLVFIAAIGAVVEYRSGSWPVAVTVWSVGGAIAALGFALPSFMRRLYLGMAYLGLPLGMAISFLVLAVVYYGVLTPIGLGLRLAGYDPLGRRFDRQASSYWVPRPADDGDLKRYFRQF